MTTIHAQPAVLIPSMILIIKFALGIAAYVQKRDWFSLYLSWSQLGVDVGFLSLSLFAGLSLRAEAGVPPDQILKSVGILTLLIVVAWGLGHEAKHCGRVHVATVYKVPFLHSAFVGGMVEKMLLGVRDTSEFAGNSRKVWLGMLFILISLNCGAVAVGIVVDQFFGVNR